jgi:low affinity Fe/Cu permease
VSSPDDFIWKEMRNLSVLERNFEWLTTKITQWLGHSISFFIAFVITIAWVGGDIIGGTPFHHLLNDAFAGFTFLMVFIIQKSQNKFSAVIHIKLNEIVASHEHASNRLIKIEDMTEEELKMLAAHYARLADNAKNGEELMTSQSIEQVMNEIEEKKS